jgi:excisionase family DNA binding protein
MYVHRWRTYYMAKLAEDTSAAYKVPEAARIARCGPRALYKLIEDGMLPHIRFGKNIIIPRAAFHRWLDNGGK